MGIPTTDTSTNRSPETQQPLTLAQQRQRYDNSVKAFAGYKNKLDEIWKLYKAQADSFLLFDEVFLEGIPNANSQEVITSASEIGRQYPMYNAVQESEAQAIPTGSNYKLLFQQFFNSRRRKDLKGDIPNNPPENFSPAPARNVLSLLNDAQNRLTGNNATEDSATAGLDVSAYKTSMNAAVRILNVLRGDIVTLERIMAQVKTQLETKNSLFRQKARGSIPDSLETIPLPGPWEVYRKRITTIKQKIDALKQSLLDDSKKMKEDIVRNITLANQGFIEDPKNPGTFIKSTNPEKDPWGIRFTVITGQSSATGNSITSSINDKLAKEAAQNNAAKKESGEKDDKAENAANKVVDDVVKLASGDKRTKLKDDLLSGTTLLESSSYYMHLLPAIRSNLPIQGGTDVPGAQPGLNFRIEHSIVKHKVPGFQPIYQPMGVDCIKCTIVGCFTGADGVQLWNEQEQLDGVGSTKGIKDGHTTIPIELWGRGDSFESFTHNVSKFDIAGLARSFDSFKNVQEFYNLIIAPGKEVEVEINLRKSDLATGGGSDGPFRDTVTGNPKFKALIKRMDTYLVRADRTWYILDLEITDGGLIGNECLNLTKELNEAKDVLKDAEIEERIADADQDLFRRCIDDAKNKVVLPSNNQNLEQFVIDLDSGYGYRGPVGKNTINQTYTPTQFLDILLQRGSGARALDEFGGFGNFSRQMSIKGNAVNKGTLVATIVKNSYDLTQIKTSVGSASDIDVSPDQAFLTHLPGDGWWDRRAREWVGWDKTSKQFVVLNRWPGTGRAEAHSSNTFIKASVMIPFLATFIAQAQTDADGNIIGGFVDEGGDGGTDNIIDRDREKAINAIREAIRTIEPKPSKCSTEQLREDNGTVDQNGVRRTSDGSTLLVEAEAPRFVNSSDCTQDQLDRARSTFSTELQAGTALLAIGATGVVTSTVLAGTYATALTSGTAIVGTLATGNAAVSLTGVTLTAAQFSTATATLASTALAGVTTVSAIFFGGVVLLAAAAVVGGIALWKKLDQDRCDKAFEAVLRTVKDATTDGDLLEKALQIFLFEELRVADQTTLTDALITELAGISIDPSFTPDDLRITGTPEVKRDTNQNYVMYTEATFRLTGNKRNVQVGDTTYGLDQTFTVEFGLSRNNSGLVGDGSSLSIRVSSVEIRFNSTADRVREEQEPNVQASANWSQPDINASDVLNQVLYDQPFASTIG